MPILRSVPPRRELLPYVRAYAQRTFDEAALMAIEPTPAQLEQILIFELGRLPGLRRRHYEIAPEIWLGGAQTAFPGFMYLYPAVESFAVFFQPAGLSRLFNIPMCEITNRVADATSVLGNGLRRVWNRLGESSRFERRVALVEEFLMKHAARVLPASRMAASATYLFHRHGAVRIPTLADRVALSLRQFERAFRHEFGASPKVFARVARFQAALDAKAASPKRTWLDVAHDFGYYDQMHMIHDFERLGGRSPTRLLEDMGDVRPPALASAEM